MTGPGVAAFLPMSATALERGVAADPATGLRRVMYRSRRRIEGDAATVAAVITDILRASSLNNAQVGLTGVLLLGPERFAQMLEGPPDALAATLERIRRDPRHDALEVIEDTRADGRAFPEWAMAYAGSGGEPDVPLTLTAALLDWTPDQSRMIALLREIVTGA